MVDFILANGYRNAKFAKFNSLQKFPPKQYIVCLTDRVDSTKQLHSVHVNVITSGLKYRH